MPRRILTVRGTPAGRASRTRATIASAVGGSLSRKPPRQRPSTFFTGQPKFRSITSKPASTSFNAAGGNVSGTAPINCAPHGCSSSPTRRNRFALFPLVTFTTNWSSITSQRVYAAPKPPRNPPHRPIAVPAQRGLRNRKADAHGAEMEVGEIQGGGAGGRGREPEARGRVIHCHNCNPKRKRGGRNKLADCNAKRKRGFPQRAGLVYASGYDYALAYASGYGRALWRHTGPEP